MDRQMIFDRVTKHLAEQKRPAMDEDEEGCAYRGADGRKCAIGCLIDDEHYAPELEGNSPLETSVATAVAQSLGIEPLRPAECRFLEKLQSAHDASENAEQLNVRLADIAAESRLTINHRVTEWSA
jgi:hypothetical protein